MDHTFLFLGSLRGASHVVVFRVSVSRRVASQVVECY